MRKHIEADNKMDIKPTVDQDDNLHKIDDSHGQESWLDDRHLQTIIDFYHTMKAEAEEGNQMAETMLSDLKKEVQTINSTEHNDTEYHLYNLDKIDELTPDEQMLSASCSDNPLDYAPISYGQFIEGLVHLTTLGIAEITDIVSALHYEILLRPIGRFDKKHGLSNWQAGMIGRIYGLVRQIVLTVGKGVTTGMQLSSAKIDSFNISFKPSAPLPYRLKLLLNAINGILGDHLVNNQSPLAIKMALYNHQKQLQQGPLSGRVIVLVHGLVMSHLGWRAGAEDGLGTQILRKQPDATVLYLDYNTGDRISTNGHRLTELLDALVKANPAITQIDLVGHSMGGLVSRSALYYGEEEQHSWINLATNFVTIGSPHHGALLERVGKYVMDMLEALPFAGTLSKIGNIRSAGIIDLRHGSVHDYDWQNLPERDVLPHEFLHPAELPLHITPFVVAGTLVGKHYDSIASDMVGDGLVAVASALGESENSTGHKNLPIPDGHKAIFYDVGHLNLLYNPRVHKQIVDWLVDDNKGAYAFSPIIHSYAESIEVEV